MAIPPLKRELEGMCVCVCVCVCVCTYTTRTKNKAILAFKPDSQNFPSIPPRHTEGGGVGSPF